jgi:hypothetical protein
VLTNVPVARILAVLCVASVFLIGLATYDGYRTSAGRLDAAAHIRFALFGIVVTLFTHTMTLFYFVGTGSRIRKVVREHRLPEALYQRTVRFKARLFPWLTATPLVTMAAFILGGGAHTRVLPAWAHGTPALAAVAMNLVTALVALRCLGENVALVDEIDAALPEAARD